MSTFLTWEIFSLSHHKFIQKKCLCQKQVNILLKLVEKLFTKTQSTFIGIRDTKQQLMTTPRLLGEVKTWF